MLWYVSLLGTNSWIKTRPCYIACWNKWCSPLWRKGNCWHTVRVEIIYCRAVTNNAYSLSHPITRTDSKYLAMKIGDIQSHLRKLQIDMIENENMNSNHLNSREWHLNGKGILQFAKNLIEVFGNYDVKKSDCIRKKYHRNHAITIPEYLQTIFYIIILFSTQCK